jgi:hypothetical protein
MSKFWITYTEAARKRPRPFRPDHMVPADRYLLDGDWLVFTIDSFDESPHQVLSVRKDDVARVELIDDWVADRRTNVESEAYRAATDSDATGKHAESAMSQQLIYLDSDFISFARQDNSYLYLRYYRWLVGDSVANDRYALQLLLEGNGYQFVLDAPNQRAVNKPGVHGPYTSRFIATHSFNGDVSAGSVLTAISDWIGNLTVQPRRSIVTEQLHDPIQLILGASSRFQLAELGAEAAVPHRGSLGSSWQEFVLVNRADRTVVLLILTSGVK